MVRWMVPFVVLLVLFVVAITVLMRDDTREYDGDKEVRITVEEGVVTFKANDGTPSTRIEAGDLAIAQANRVEVRSATKPDTIASPPTPVTIEKPVPTTDALLVHVLDALGTPISRGRVSVGRHTYPFQNGQVSIPVLDRQTAVLAAEADGYRSATRTVRESDTDEVSLVLEYLCSFELKVYATKEKRRSAAGVDVFLWQGYEPQRPVRETASINSGLFDLYDITLRRERDGVRIVRVQDKPTGPKGPLRPPPPGGLVIAGVGDVILGLSGCMWRPGDRMHFYPPLFSSHPMGLVYQPKQGQNSPALRIWDTFGMSNVSITCTNNLKNIMNLDFAELERGGERAYANVILPEVFRERKFVRKEKTDASGRCLFEGLPPGIYYAQAQANDKRSAIVTFHPARERIEHHLSDSGKVYVDAGRAGIEAHRIGFRAIEGARVTLRGNESTENRRILTSQTNHVGRAVWDSVPWGTYRLTVQPPEGIPGAPKSQMVTVENSRHYFFVDFDTGHTVSGRVVQEETGEPVEGYTLELHRTHTHAGRVGVETTDEDGLFTFENLQSGEHGLSGEHPSNTDTGYFPARSIAMADFMTPRSRPSRMPFEVVDESVEGLEFRVVPSVKTRFEGTVTHSDSSPAIGASISINEGDWIFAEPNPATGEDGRFALTLVGRASSTPRKANITATVADVLPPHWQTIDSGALRFIGETARIRAQGDYSAEFRAGETITGILIELDSRARTNSVVGTIKTDDGEWPENVRVHVKQGEFRIPGEVSEAGTYRVQGVAPGKFALVVDTNSYSVETERFGRQYEQGYANKYISLVMPDDERTLTADVTLQRSSHLAGIIVDAQQNPVHGAVVRIQHHPKWYGMDVTTERNGLFWLTPVLMSDKYTIEVLREGESEPAVRLENLKPPIENIVIQVKD